VGHEAPDRGRPPRPGRARPTRCRSPAAPTSWSSSTSTAWASRPEALLDLTGCRRAARSTWGVPSATADGRGCRLGAGVTYARVIAELGDRLPGLAMAARTVGSPQIRNRGTVGGNLGSASPAGDAHPPLLAAGAVVEVASAARRAPAGAGRRVLHRPEAQRARRRRADRRVGAAGRVGPQQFCQGRHPQRDGDRGVLAFASRCTPTARVGTGIGSAAPTPRRAREAEEFLAGELDGRAVGLPRRAARGAGRASASWSPRRPRPSTTSAAAPPTAGTRCRCWRGAPLTWAWDEYRRAA
jgi:hypothetical protein